ncbi:hypothetical protein [Aeromicrobium sp. UC242_57]|uniref:hypothetical protein n=1 Tax=Aeromicrobium sp. UC242_57 TaxID=3374624 RepID=UPI0037AA540F
MRFSFVVIAGLLLGFSLAACASDGPDSSPMPDGIKVEVDQSRYQQSGRTLFVSIQNGTDQQITISDFTLSSPRFDDVDWSGDDVLEAGQKTDIDFTMPRGRCGSDLDASIAVTYQVDGGRPQISTTTVDDLYDHALYFADRDCAQLTFEEAAKVEIGQPQVSGADVRRC